MKYTVTFYQAGCEGIEPQTYATKREACAAASEFVDGYSLLLRFTGYRREGNVRTDGYTRYVHPVLGTDVCATVTVRYLGHDCIVHRVSK